jgi:putative acetyltransferase
VKIRPERANDERATSALITRAFAGAAHASGEEAAIVDRLRRDGDLAAAFVAVDGESIVGLVAFSPVLIDGAECSWFGLGPVGVAPERQRAGVGRALIEHGLAHLTAQGAQGCVVLGDPAYYCRFGFGPDRALVYPAAPAEYFQRIVFGGEAHRGIVSYAPAFD